MPSAGQQKRKRIWQHNSFMGFTKMMQGQCLIIIKSSTATAQAKRLATEIHSTARLLSLSLKERID